ncbi:MAG: hypothetical protein R3E90_14180 [Marinicella sp.]
MKKIILGLIFFGYMGQVEAVHKSNNRTGQVLIYPYYTVNNGLDTIYSVVNTTEHTKAIKVNFYEASNGANALTFNVYLSAYDVWTGVLVPVSSEHEGHFGEASITHLTTDTSCAPFLRRRLGQEFLPENINGDHNADMSRLREGHFVILEMGKVSYGSHTYAFTDHTVTGIPADCNELEAAWDNNQFAYANEISEPTGGLLGSASIIDVSDGVSFSYDAIALENFWGEEIVHTAPENPEPDLSFSMLESKVLMPNGDVVVSNWDSGYKAVSAVLMQSKIINENVLDIPINGQTEWVVTMPTKYFHTNFGSSQAVRFPFSSEWNGMNSCDEFIPTIWDREEQLEVTGIVCTAPLCPPEPPNPNFCKTSNVLEFYLPTTDLLSRSKVLGTSERVTIASPRVAHATESGWGRLILEKDDISLTSSDGHVYKGLPVVGFAVQKYFNANAQPGLLAKYGSLFVHKGISEIDGDN